MSNSKLHITLKGGKGPTQKSGNTRELFHGEDNSFTRANGVDGDHWASVGNNSHTPVGNQGSTSLFRPCGGLAKGL